MPLNLKHQTRAEFRRRLRADMRDSIGSRTVHLADKIMAMVSDGDLTEAEMRAEFGFTAAQWNAAKVRFNNLINARRTLRAAQGE
jgi:hypothetical protein